jgi:hypothetical protein
MELRWERRAVGLRTPLASAWGELRERDLFAVELDGGDG